MKSFTTQARRTGVYCGEGADSGVRGSGVRVKEQGAGMKLPFLRKTERDEPLVVSMTGVRLGDRLLYVGARPTLFEPLAARVGLSGQTTLVGPEAPMLKADAERNGLLVDAAISAPADATYDLAIVEARGDWAQALRAVFDAIRRGGRLIVIAGEPRGWLGKLRSTAEAPSDTDIVRALETSGWSSARSLGGQGELRFVESVKR